MTHTDTIDSELGVEFSPDQLAIREQVAAQLRRVATPFDPTHSVASLTPKPKGTHRAKGSGTFYFNAQRNRWVGRIQINGKRTEVWGGSREEVVSKLAQAIEPKRSGHLDADRSTLSYFDIDNSVSPDVLELLAKVGIDILDKCEWQGEHLLWRKSLPMHQGARTGRLYGRVGGTLAKAAGTDIAHRVVWQRVYGPIPDGQQVNHTCPETLCLRPDHLVLAPLRTPTFQLEVSVLRPARESVMVTAASFENALLQARDIPGLVEVLSIQKGE